MRYFIRRKKNEDESAIPAQVRSVQAKLEIGRPGDLFEKQADAVADRVMMMPYEKSLQMSPASSRPELRMKCSDCEQEDKVQMKSEDDEKVQMKSDDEEKLQMKRNDDEEKVQMKPVIQKFSNGNAYASSDFSNKLQRRKGYGQALPQGINGEMSAKIGADFSAVNIHTGPEAVQMTREIGAQAFTHGNDIYFNKGKYAPASAEGKHLLAHELTHVVQQTASEGVIQMQPRTTVLPDVTGWTIRTSGSRSSDNCCTACPATLGVNCCSPNMYNGIELKASIANHQRGFTYDVKRNMHVRYWRRDGTGAWENYRTDGPNHNDDNHNSDECLRPISDGRGAHYIYVADNPGFETFSARTSRTDYVQIMNMTEFVRITKPDGSTYDDATQQNWHNKTWITQSAPGTWAVNARSSEIGRDHLANLNP